MSKVNLNLNKNIILYDEYKQNEEIISQNEEKEIEILFGY